MINISQILNGLGSNLGMGVVIATAGIVSSTAAFKLADSLANTEPNSNTKIEITQPVDQTVAATVSSPTAIAATDTPVSTTAPTSTSKPSPTSGSATFDAAALAQHNKVGDCYVAYNGTVYDVSNHFAWTNCWHHGISGGQDITSRFPHPTSYLAGLRVVGKYTGPITSGNPGNGGDDNGGEHEGNDD